MLRWSKSGKTIDEPKPKSMPAPVASPAPRPAPAASAPRIEADVIPRQSLPDVLLEAGKVTKDQLARALKKQAESGEFLGEILVREGILDERSLTSFLAKYCRIPHLSLLDYLIDKDVVKLIPKEICLRYRLLPIDQLGQNLTVAMVNPLNAEALDKVRELCPDLRIKPILCAYQHFLTVTSKLFEEQARGGGPVELTASSLGLSVRDIAPVVPAFELEANNTEPEPEAGISEPEPVAAPDEIPEAVEIVEAEPASFDRDSVIQSVFQGGLDSEPNQAPAPAPATDDSPAASIMQEMAGVMMDSMRDTYSMLARRMELFHGVDPEDVAKIFARGMTIERDAGQTVFNKGDKGDRMYLVLGGKVEVFDEHRVIAVLERGDMFGEMALLSDEPRSASVRAVEPASMLALSHEIIWNIMPREVAMRLLVNIVITLSTRLRLANERP